MGELVEIRNGMIFTTSNIIGEEFGIAHNHILEKIKSIDAGVEREYVNSRNRKYKEYSLTLKEALSIIMLSSGAKCNAFKMYFVELISGDVSVEDSYYTAIKLMKKDKYEPIESVTYFIRDYETKKVKIGKTKRNLDLRLRDLQRSTPNLLEIECYINKDVESKLHRKYAMDKVISEWFDIDEATIHNIRNEHKRYFFYCNTLDCMLSELSMQVDGSKEFEIKDIIGEREYTSSELKIIKDELEKGIENNENYKVIFEKCKTALEVFANSLLLGSK